MEDRKRKRGWSRQVHSLSDLVTYHTGSVVSRAILEKETGTVTVSAFDEGEGLSEHTARFDALVHVLEGSMAIDIAGEPHPMRGGDILILPAHQPHALQAVERSKLLLTMIRS